MLLIDAHVHMHPCFSIPLFLDSAYDNFRAQAVRFGKESSFAGVLLMAETAAEKSVERLKAYLQQTGDEGEGACKWSLRPGGEATSLICEQDERRLFIISGRQMVTSEKLEVLALATDRKMSNGRPLRETLRVLKECGAIPVIPWAVGKWLGRRGRILENSLLEMHAELDLFLADNGGRPSFWPDPSLFEVAKDHSIRILSGSDPLPLAAEARRVGSFGVAIEAHARLDNPAAEIRRILMSPKSTWKPFGALCSPHRFLLSQVALRFTRLRSSNP